MAAMFTMMNAARLSIGLQGPAVAERAFQQAHRYALTRQQGRAPGPDSDQLPIIWHPDVARMLLSMRTSLTAARLLLYTAGRYRDLARYSDDPEKRSFAQSLLDLLTPVAKSWATDIGFSAVSTGLQIFGGAGYLEETGMAQHLRDLRIASIYEGTNGIQAVDLVMRKLIRDGGLAMRSLLDMMCSAVDHVSDSVDGERYRVLRSALAILHESTEQVIAGAARSPEQALAVASSYLEMAGLTAGGWLMVRRAELAKTRYPALVDQLEAEGDFFAIEHLSRVEGLARPVAAERHVVAVALGQC